MRPPDVETPRGLAEALGEKRERNHHTMPDARLDALDDIGIDWHSMSDDDFERAWLDLSQAEKDELPDSERKHNSNRYANLHEYVAKGAERLAKIQARRETSKPSPQTVDALDSENVGVDDFHAHLPQHNYIFVPTREMWPAASVNAIVPPIETGRLDKKGEKEFVAASKWLDENKSIHQVTWSPGDPLVVQDRLVTGGGWIDHVGCATFNLYLPPVIKHGDPTKANRWLELGNKIYPDSAEHIIKWLAHRVQKPHEKINHALVIGGMQGIGKDTMLEPVKHAIGPWNFTEISPQHLLGRFNGFTKSVILRMSEARDLGDVDRFALYDHSKIYTAAPPDVLRCDEKNIREFSVLNVCGVIITTNHKADGIYLPADDRRHYVAWSDAQKKDFDTDYWTHLYKWFSTEGIHLLHPRALSLARISVSTNNRYRKGLCDGDVFSLTSLTALINNLTPAPRPHVTRCQHPGCQTLTTRCWCKHHAPPVGRVESLRRERSVPNINPDSHN